MTETHITVILDQGTTRACIKHRLDPVPFMMDALHEELHTRALAAGVKDTDASLTIKALQEENAWLKAQAREQATRISLRSEK